MEIGLCKKGKFVLLVDGLTLANGCKICREDLSIERKAGMTVRARGLSSQRLTRWYQRSLKKINDSGYRGRLVGLIIKAKLHAAPVPRESVSTADAGQG